MKFSLTGHLVFSTVHANDAPGTITRLLDIGIAPFLVGSCLNKDNRKLMTVPFDENPYSALAAFFKTDEGVEVYKAIDKKLK